MDKHIDKRESTLVNGGLTEGDVRGSGSHVGTRLTQHSGLAEL